MTTRTEERVTLSELRRAHERFADDNPLLFVTLGLLSSFDKLDRILREHAPAKAAPTPEQAETRASEVDEAGVHFLLGLLAVRARLRDQLGRALPAPPPAEPLRGPAPPPRRESLLR